MVAMTFFLFGDQNLASPNLSRIGAAFGITDEAEYRAKIAGHASLYFFVIGGIASILVGAFTDIWNRKLLLFGTVFAGELACFFTAFAPNYTTYIVLRTLTGIGLGGIFPIIFSLLGDHFKPENRSSASGWLALAMGLGIGVGQILGGMLATATVFGLEGWRASFAIMAGPCFPLLFLYLAIGETPKRGGAENVHETTGAEPKHSLGLADFKRIASSKTNILAILQGIPGCVPWGLIFFFLVDYYEKSKGFKPSDGVLLTTVFGGVLIFGGFIGGFVGRAVYNWKKAALPIFCAACVLLGIIPMIYILNFQGTSMLYPMIAAALGGIVIPQAGPNIRSILVNTNLPENRGSIFGVFNFADDLGKGLGPFVVGEILRLVGSDSLAYNLAIYCWIPCAIGWLLMAFTMEADEKKVEDTLIARGAKR